MFIFHEDKRNSCRDEYFIVTAVVDFHPIGLIKRLWDFCERYWSTPNQVNVFFAPQSFGNDAVGRDKDPRN